MKVAVKKNFLNSILLLVIILIATTGYFGYKNFQLQKGGAVISNPNAAPQNLQLIIDEVGKLLVLPDNEVPTIATVTDLENLKDQPFFKNAQVGDRVLIYSKSAKGILYRPSIKKIIEVAPINTNR